MERRHILVVEDERPTLTLLEKILTGAGYRVTGVLDGIAALKAARADPPDLVLLDLIIPGVDGYGVCVLLKRSLCFPAGPLRRMSRLLWASAPTLSCPNRSTA